MATSLQSIDRNRLTDQLMRWMSPNDQGYFITLNSLSVLNGHTDPRFERVTFALQPKVVKAMSFLKEHCFGNGYRRYHDESRLKCLVSYEVGSDKNRLHAHIVAAHNGETDRDCDSVARFLDRKWAKLLRLEYNASSFVHVAPIDLLRDRVWYVTKQAGFLARWNDISSLDFA